ncbi:MAG TPA: dTDP-4-dehydrorhamnose 3,5-epimerase family protein [Gemmatales bacterium]|nr:dTDP-4-dehydrorhamnose 3,5-epimerase family protein [Gemmatales bacterium]
METPANSANIVFRPGIIADVVFKPLTLFHDHRGWLCEFFRNDEVPAEYRPVMAYTSLTLPGIVRGPHEHVTQSDYFCFIGPSDFALYLWDNRPQSSTYRVHQVERIGASRPMAVIIPPGVVHGYKNVGGEPGLVFNAANQLYKGEGKSQPVDEIRHEHDPASPFRIT